MARGRYGYGYDAFPPYVPVAQRRHEAQREVAALKKKGRPIAPVEIEGRTIARSFWGKSWCDNLEAYSDYANRLPRGRTYVRNGSVVHLEIGEGKVVALVRGSSMYTVTIEVKALPGTRWTQVVRECSGKIDSLVELLQGKLSQGVMAVVTHKERGLFPSPKDIKLACTCPDWADMCKHVAAALYGVGARLDHEPALLFRLRKVDPGALLTSVAVEHATGKSRAGSKVLQGSALSSVFGIDLDEAPLPANKPKAPKGLGRPGAPKKKPKTKRA